MNIENIADETNLVPLQGLGVYGGSSIFVIADDITGAAEIAGVCLRYGRTVSFGIDAIPDVLADICIIATDTRSLTEDEAYTIHAKIASELSRKAVSLLFRKCDSVLRGFVLAEIAATLEHSHYQKVLLSPANPFTGRCIVGGHYYVGGQLIHETGFSIDPDFPAFHSDVQSMLLQRSAVYGNSQGLMENGKLIVPDCESMDELKQICSLADEQTLLCGSAVFFEQMMLYKGVFSEEMNTDAAFTLSTDFLLIAGTTHPESKRFAEKLQKNNCPVIKFPEEFLTEIIDEDAFAEWVNALVNQWQVCGKMSVGLSDRPVEFPDSKAVLKARLSAVASRLLESCEVKELLIEGGATTYSLLSALQWNSLTPLAELAPGVLRMKVNNSAGTFLTIKPGSYSWPEMMI
jgi:uncharacterized protein YgbK (DUF1537 family)